MTIRVALHHRTAYQYDRLVTLSPQIVRLRPAPHCRTPIVSYSLHVEPEDHFLNWQQDPQGNFQARLVFSQQTRRFSVDVDLIAEMTVVNPFDFFMEPNAETYPFQYDHVLDHELKPFLTIEPVGPKLADYVSGIDRSQRKTVDFLVELNQRLQQDIEYVVRMEPGVQTCEETLQLAKGSCRDTAWLLIQILRNLGLAARFVSGYLIQLVADEKPLDGPAGPEQDFTDLHAWAEVYLPGAGWVGLDPTSGLLAGEGHIPLAATPDPQSAAPISGSVSHCQTEFDFAMSVTRIHEDPRVTKPYSEEQWQRIQSLGHQVDQQLTALDVRLTMGGEPTFVSIDDMEGAEWRTAAVGPAKQLLSGKLLRRLQRRFGTGGFLHFGQGKWYPGESLPRWAYSCYWRKDGQPIWNDPQWLADPTDDHQCTAEQAERFMAGLCRRLGVSTRHIVRAYEDALYYVWKERRLPENVDPRDSKIEDPEERDRLAQVFERGLTEPVGCVLPLTCQWWQGKARWRSGAWPIRGKEFALVPGDSPIGLRLPLKSLPWSASVPYPTQSFPLDPLAPREPLPIREQMRQFPGQDRPAEAHEERKQEEPEQREQPDETDAEGLGEIVQTALCVEPRGGTLHVFMPPIDRVEDYLDLLAAVEEVATEQKVPVIIEGYPPPHDHRIEHLKVTPDPGVIEVNVQPASHWQQLVDITTGIYEDARQTRLGTEKFDLDGGHTGTGGGNHIVLGGPTPQDSPFLRRPHLLRSLIGYWQNHPSLSYLFSGAFIGPTSQAPRVDEGRRDSLYELQIAFDQIPDDGECPPWMVDRVFRHLLTDITGNTHRAEFCIDKLFSPDGSSGRLGLVEFRAFEMPPHARMSLTQQLLLRALVARFWQTPYRGKLVDWGTSLHDRFLMPHFVWQDFEDVIGETREAGFPLESPWFAPHFEFRFPKIGEIAHRGIVVELREAIEPWYVLGEEPGGGGTVRFVDSSVERLQVKVDGMTDLRHVITCNGRKVPLHPTGRAGQFVAAVRYRAWQPPSCLHPTIPVHEPLLVDVVDTWSGRSIGGCTYHVGHPGGLNPDTFPINANEAESRRAARFFKMGHTVGKVSIPPDEPNPEFPLTLDLRRRRPA